jgi:hypothetical protein
MKPALSSSRRAEGAGAFRPLNTASISMAFRPGLYMLRKDVVFVWLNLQSCFFLWHDFSRADKANKISGLYRLRKKASF